MENFASNRKLSSCDWSKKTNNHKTLWISPKMLFSYAFRCSSLDWTRENVNRHGENEKKFVQASSVFISNFRFDFLSIRAKWKFSKKRKIFCSSFDVFLSFKSNHLTFFCWSIIDRERETSVDDVRVRRNKFFLWLIDFQQNQRTFDERIDNCFSAEFRYQSRRKTLTTIRDNVKTGWDYSQEKRLSSVEIFRKKTIWFRFR